MLPASAYELLPQGSCEESGFATSKAAGEAAVKEIFPDATIVRPATMIGENDRFLCDNASMGKLFPVFPLVDGGHAKRSPVWVNDVAEVQLQSITAAFALIAMLRRVSSAVCKMPTLLAEPSSLLALLNTHSRRLNATAAQLYGC